MGRKDLGMQDANFRSLNSKRQATMFGICAMFGILGRAGFCGIFIRGVC